MNKHLTVITWLHLMFVSSCLCAVREYFIASQEVTWDYTPGGKNLANPDDQETADKYVKPGPNRIGSRLRKTLYFRYTNENFTEEIPAPEYLGLLGPVIYGEVGDVILVHFFNNASRNFSIHPHGVFYEKGGEGALYQDGTSDLLKEDDGVVPGETILLVWNVTENDAPGEGDPNCLPWVYHSHVDSVQDVSTGLFGVIVTCRQGVLNEKHVRQDVDREYPLVVMNWDENLSWHLENNLDLFCPDPDLCRRAIDEGDEEFQDSNLKKSINGRSFGTLKGLEACVGDRVQFYVIGFGNEMDIHSLHFHGQNLKFQHRRGDTVSVFSATFVSVVTTAQTPGNWLVTDMVDDNGKEGISAFYHIKTCSTHGEGESSESRGATREFFLAVEETVWNYAPTGRDARTGMGLTAPNSLLTKIPDSLTSNTENQRDTTLKDHPPSYYSWLWRAWWRESRTAKTYFERSSSRLGGVYKKAKFVQYTSSSFRTKVTIPPQETHLGVMGPVLRVEVGDTLVVTLKNLIPFPVSLMVHGVGYESSEEDKNGPGVPGGSVGKNEVHRYKFKVPGNLLDDRPEPCVNFLYTSAHDPGRDHNTGLVGQLLVCAKGFLSRREKPLEFFLLLATFDENKSLYMSPDAMKGDYGFQLSNIRFSINGYSYGNMPTLNMCVNDDVMWYVMAMGSVIDVHTLVFDGNTFTEMGTNRDGRWLVPGSTAVLTMMPDNIGKWMFYSQSTLARDNGAFAFYNVVDCIGKRKKQDDAEGTLREYYISADEVLWEYAPRSTSVITGAALNETEASIFYKNDENFIGTVYKKAVFTEYTNAKFTHAKPRDSDLLGPAIKAEVGDTVKVTFKNNASRPYSMHSHGVLTSQQNSGMDYGRATRVKPGQTVTYEWGIPERSGPGPNDPNCVPWLYYSAVEAVRDVNSGLVGVMVVCRRGTLNKRSERKDVDQELYIYMSVSDENLSWYLEDNIRNFAPGRVGTDYRNDEEFVESNKKHAINGRLSGNNHNLVIEYGSKVVFYMAAMGGETDLHTMHLHGHTFVHTSEKHRDDVIQIFPGMAESVELIADNPGTWLIHCHVMDHIFAGMETTYTVLKPGEKLSSSIKK
ncbi:hephaestin-like [Physella acuta]|uniref:hephaestin-like n=1 Tax=Physella acuta TaxID=109671 RepID=UPI0027DE70DA|nr:hephaestin-like [Physella acuta]